MIAPPTLTLPRKGGGNKRRTLPARGEGTREEPSPTRGEGTYTVLQGGPFHDAEDFRPERQGGAGDRRKQGAGQGDGPGPGGGGSRRHHLQSARERASGRPQGDPRRYAAARQILRRRHEQAR